MPIEGRDAALTETGSPELLLRLAKMAKINAVLMERVERAMDYQGNAFSLFQTAITLEGQVRARTEELTQVLRSLERSNAQHSAAKEEADRANLSKTRFLAAASHDLLQPVHAARLSISALTEMQQSGEARRLAAQVDSGLQTIEDLIKTLLDISKLDAGIVKPELRVFALNDVLLGLHSTFESLTLSKGLKLRVRPSPLTVESDPALLQRVLQNLLTNAIRYTSRGGVLVGARQRNGLCHLDVLDTGFGIPENQLDRIFDEFYRGAAAPRDDQTGLGLGLSIVKRITQALGCELTVKSAPDKGSRFRVALPLATGISAPFPRNSEKMDIPYCLDGAVVLIVENDRFVADAMQQLFLRWSCHPIAAQNLGQVDRIIADMDRLPDILIADYHLDCGETGLATLARLRTWDADIPALIVTADHSEGAASLIRAAGAELMQKPVSPGALRATVSHLLATREAMRLRPGIN